MAEAAKPKLRKLVGPALFRELVSSSISALSEERAEELKEAVHEITDGKTQLQFMLDLGLAKKPGALPPRPPARKLTPEEEARGAQNIAITQVTDLMAYMGIILDNGALAECEQPLLEQLDGLRIDLGHKIDAIRKARRNSRR
jgi:hypothetical protein